MLTCEGRSFQMSQETLKLIFNHRKDVVESTLYLTQLILFVRVIA